MRYPLAHMIRRFRIARRAAVAPMTAVMAPAMLMMTSLIVDTGLWVDQYTRLQIAADAGAMGAGFLLTTSLKSAVAATQTSTLQSVALYEAQAAATKLTGTITTPITVTPNSGWTAVTVTITSTATSIFGGVFNVTAPTIKASATVTLQGGVATPCVLALGSSGVGIQADNMGVIGAQGCPIMSDSSGTPAIYLNSGNISGSSIAAVGTVTKSNSGSNTMNPSTPTSGATAQADPLSSLTMPTPSTTADQQKMASCGANGSSSGNFTQWQANPYVFPTANSNSYVFCGNTTIGGNGTTDSFAAGTYFIVNGDLTFNNATISSNSFANVQFVMTNNSNGTVGNFSWTNYSNAAPFTMTAPNPSSSGVAGIFLWQGCNSSGSQTASFQGGSQLNVSGTMYMPCAAVTVGNNAHINAALTYNASSGCPTLTQPFSLIAKSMWMTGSGMVCAYGSSSSGSSTTQAPILTQ